MTADTRDNGWEVDFCFALLPGVSSVSVCVCVCVCGCRRVCRPEVSRRINKESVEGRKGKTEQEKREDKEEEKEEST